MRNVADVMEKSLFLTVTCQMCRCSRSGSATTASSGSVSRRTATTPTPRSSTATTAPGASGTWPSTRGAKPKWAPVHGSSLNTSPRTSCPGSASRKGASEASPSLTGAKRDARARRRLPDLRQGGLTSTQELRPNAHRSSTGPSTALGNHQGGAGQKTDYLSLSNHSRLIRKRPFQGLQGDFLYHACLFYFLFEIISKCL